MKTLLALGLLLSAEPVLAQVVPPAGQEAAVPFKGATMIVLHTTDSAKVAYAKIARVLLDNGYALDKSDGDLLFVNTKPRSASRLNVVQALQASVRGVAGGSVIQLSGFFTSPVLPGQTTTQFRGMKGSPMMICWEDMQKVAASYAGATFAYKNP